MKRRAAEPGGVGPENTSAEVGTGGWPTGPGTHTEDAEDNEL